MSAVLPSVTRLSSRVVRLLGCNPSPYTFQGTNTYLVGTGSRRVLIDCGSKGMDQYLANLREFLEHERVTLSRVVVTHWHPDHIGGLAAVMDSLNLKSPACRFHKWPDAAHDHEISGWDYVTEGSKIEVEGATLRVVHTPGHTQDHIGLVLEEDNSLFSGDCILGEGRGVVFEDLALYLDSLRKMSELKPNLIYPGHGPVVEDPLQRISEYIERQLEREARIVAAMSVSAEAADPSPGVGLTLKEIFQRVWRDAPAAKTEGIMYNLKKHLNKLINEKKVKKIDPDEGGPENGEREAQMRFYLSSSL